jgi:hypothetical protein
MKKVIICKEWHFFSGQKNRPHGDVRKIKSNVTHIQNFLCKKNANCQILRKKNSEIIIYIT